jgi:molecular chaperone GrpE (heat shock protein)
MKLLFLVVLALAVVSTDSFSSVTFGRKLLSKSLDFSPIDTTTNASTSLRMVADAEGKDAVDEEVDVTTAAADGTVHEAEVDVDGEEEEVTEEEEAIEEDGETVEGDDSEATIENVVETDGNATEAVVGLTPMEQAVEDYEKKLAMQLKDAEVRLRSERMLLTKLKDRESESGKNGFFMVQAQVNEFQKRRDSDQKKKVLKNKRDFVEKMLPVVDAFQKAEANAPASTDQVRFSSVTK